MADLSRLPLLEWIPEVSPQLHSPIHLVDWTSMIERTLDEPVRGLCSVPTRHHKTITTLHGAVWILQRRPSWRIVLIGYDHVRAQWMGKMTRTIRDRAGIDPVRGDDTIVHWSVEGGGGVHCISADQSAIGYDAHVVIADDPITEKGFHDPAVRDAADESLNFYESRAVMSGLDGGRLGSFLLVMSRGHPDDPYGRRLNRKHWESVQAKAILSADESHEAEHPWAPNLFSIETLRQIREGIYERDPTGRTWLSQWMNDPLPDELGLFRKPRRYVELPSASFTSAIGGDLAYSKKAHSDHCAVCTGRIYVEDGQSVLYVTAMWRERWDPVRTEQILRMAMGQNPGACVYSYMSGPEIGIAHYLAEKQIAIEVMHPTTSKRQRAQRTIDMANAGRIRFPEHAPWVPGFIHRLELFSGLEDAGDDDEVDALVSLVDGAIGMACPEPRGVGKWRNERRR